MGEDVAWKIGMALHEMASEDIRRAA
jgi:hypothetical protein